MPPRLDRNSGFTVRPPSAGSVTKVLCATLLVLSILGKISQNQWGFGTNDLSFQVERVFSLELWRLVTYPFVEAQPFSLIISLLLLWLFGGWFESRWGSRDFLRFFALASVGAALLAIPLSLGINWLLPFRDIGIALGPGPALDAMLVALAMTNPDSTVLFGFVLPIRARTLVFLILGYNVLVAIMDNAATLSITLGGMGMGYLLVTGSWRLSVIQQKVRTLIDRRRRKRHGLYVVPPRDRTLH